MVSAFWLAKRLSIYPIQCIKVNFLVQTVKCHVQIGAICRLRTLFSSLYTFSNQSIGCKVFWKFLLLWSVMQIFVLRRVSVKLMERMHVTSSQPCCCTVNKRFLISWVCYSLRGIKLLLSYSILRIIAWFLQTRPTASSAKLIRRYSARFRRIIVNYRWSIFTSRKQIK